MKVLITGAWGNLGVMCVEQALAAGHEVRCFDLPGKKNRQTAHEFQLQHQQPLEIRWGDISHLPADADLLQGIDAVIHNASVLPPLSENNPALAYQVNVEGTAQLIRLAEKSGTAIPFVFPSSVTVFGKPTVSPSLKTVHDPTCATDHYTNHKLLCEKLLQQSQLNWCILRVGVSVDSRTTKTDLNTLKGLLKVNPDNALEFVHPKDVACAMCNAVTTPPACKKILLIGGGAHCRVTQAQFMNAALNGCGLHLKPASFGDNPYYTHWMDTEESQQLLNYQQHTFSDYQREMAAAMKTIRTAVLPFRPLANWLLNRWVAQLSKA